MKKIKFDMHKIIALVLICVLIVTCVKSIAASVIGTSNKNEMDNVLAGDAMVYGNTLENNKKLNIEETENKNVDDAKDIVKTLSYNKVTTTSTITNNSTDLSKDDKTNKTNKKSSDKSIKNKNKSKSKTYSKKEIYELAKIIMCEAEGESQKCKEYVGQVVLNRVNSKSFPNNIHDVIFQGHQFSPTFDGRWEKVEPNQDCYDAAYTVINASKPLTKALYFEACSGSSWHSRNLTQVAEIDNTRFYK